MIAFAIRSEPIMGTRYRKYSITVGGKVVHEQVGPMSEDEIEERVNAYLHPMGALAYRPPDFVPGARAYGAKGGKAGRRPKAAVGHAPWTQTEEE